ncbi:MAG: maleylpyruvate isomerase family mycothiol-dependent enzyme [Actinomycetota bacterium]|nr:maleylpyruvate isomerase family mycothiol-dependent enzyme [Actinomycetota bacterium]
MAELSDWVRAVRDSHERFTALVSPLSSEQVSAPSYDDDWTIAQVASHLGSQGEIFQLFLDAGRSGQPAPGREVFQGIWDDWNALAPQDQVRQSIDSNARFVARLEETALARDAFALSFFGRELDLAGFAGMRLSEHAVHTWDIEVALDPTATIAPGAVQLLLPRLPETAARGTAVEGAPPVLVTTTSPDARFLLTLSPEVSLAPATHTSAEGHLALPAEAFLRLVYGRLDAQHTPDWVSGSADLDQLRKAFPGF